MTWIQETMIKGDSDLFEKIQRSLQQWISHEGFHLLRHGQDLSKELFEKRSDFQLEELKALHANVSRLEDELYDFQNDIRNFLKNEPKGFHCDFRPSSSSRTIKKKGKKYNNILNFSIYSTIRQSEFLT